MDEDREATGHAGPCCGACEEEWYEWGAGTIGWGYCCCRDERIPANGTD